MANNRRGTAVSVTIIRGDYVDYTIINLIIAGFVINKSGRD